MGIYDGMYMDISWQVTLGKNLLWTSRSSPTNVKKFVFRL